MVVILNNPRRWIFNIIKSFIWIDMRSNVFTAPPDFGHCIAGTRAIFFIDAIEMSVNMEIGKPTIHSEFMKKFVIIWDSKRGYIKWSDPFYLNDKFRISNVAGNTAIYYMSYKTLIWCLWKFDVKCLSSSLKYSEQVNCSTAIYIVVTF